MSVLPRKNICAPYVCLCLQRSKEGVEFSGTDVDHCKPTDECWEPNPGPLKEQQVKHS